MAKFELKTKSGHNFFDMASMLQKAVRRADIYNAGYAANELYYHYQNYCWKRLLVISAEDCYGIMTKEIVALMQADEVVNKGKADGKRDLVFVAKAVTLLCMARKNRDACYVACNFMFPDRDLKPEEIEHVDISEYEKYADDELPEYIYDSHTLKGKRMGKDCFDSLMTEKSALKPYQPSLFDEGSWEPYYNQKIKDGKLVMDAKKQEKYDGFKRGKEPDPTHGGEKWSDDF